MEQQTQKYYIGDSQIHGKGVLATRNLRKNEVIDMGIGFAMYFIPYVTPYFGSFINHSYTPNAYLWYYDGYTNNTRQSYDPAVNEVGWYVRTLRPIQENEEITVNYNHTPWYIEGALPHYV
jgi:hypothetical protein